MACFYLLVRGYGLTGAALAFSVVYLWYMPLIFLTVRHYTGFRWSAGPRRVLLAGLGAYALALLLQQHLAGLPRWIAGTLLVAGVSAWSYPELCHRLDMPILRRLTRRSSGPCGGGAASPEAP